MELFTLIFWPLAVVAAYALQVRDMTHVPRPQPLEASPQSRRAPTPPSVSERDIVVLQSGIIIDKSSSPYRVIDPQSRTMWEYRDHEEFIENVSSRVGR